MTNFSKTLRNLSAKEKSNELIENYRYRLLPFITFQTQLTEADLFNKCKQCALIAIDEILSEIYSNKCTTTDERRMFWQEVKQEIEKL